MVRFVVVFCLALLASCGSPDDFTEPLSLPSVNNIDPKYQAYVDEFSARCKKAMLPCHLKHLTVKEVDTLYADDLAGFATWYWDGPIYKTVISIKATDPDTGLPWTEHQLKYLVFHELFHASLYKRHVSGDTSIMSTPMPRSGFIEQNLESMIDDAFN